MEPKEMKLPELERVEFLRGFRPREWFVDPVFLDRLKLDVAIDIVRIRMNYLAEAAKAEAKMFEEISKVLSKQK